MADEHKSNFLITLEEMTEGKVIKRLDEELAKVIEAVGDTTKVGSVTLKLSIKWENAMAMVSADVTTKIPQHGLPASLFYFGNKEDGKLYREDPRQLTLRNLEPKKPAPLRAVAELPVAPIREGDPGDPDTETHH